MMVPHPVFTRSIACWLFLSLVLVALPVPASARTFTNPVNETLDVTTYEYWEGIVVNSSQQVKVSVNVNTGARVDVYIVDGANLGYALNKTSFDSVMESLGTNSASLNYGKAGTYAVIVETTGIHSLCQIKIEVGEPSYDVFIGVVAIFAFVGGGIGVAYVLMRRAQAKRAGEAAAQQPPEAGPDGIPPGGGTTMTSEPTADGSGLQMSMSGSFESASYTLCEHCWKPIKLGPDEMNCPKCGAALYDGTGAGGLAAVVGAVQTSARRGHGHHSRAPRHHHSSGHGSGGGGSGRHRLRH